MEGRLGMDAGKSKKVVSKLHKTSSRLGTKIENKIDDNLHVDELNDNEKVAIEKMKALYMDTLRLDIELQNGIYKLEKQMEPRQNAIYDKRAKLLADFRKKCSTGDAKHTSHVANFWLKVLKASYTEFITPKDEAILVHLIDIRSTMSLDPDIKFVLEFIFEPNEYFSNTKLTKTYYLNALPNPEDPLSFDGAEIVRCEGCKINWKRKPHTDPEQKKYLYSFSSFFDFFSPPSTPKDLNDPHYEQITALLQNDFELGFYLKERVIPKAVLFFTGEIVDCQTSDTESDDENAQELDDEDDDINDGGSSAISNEN